MNYYPTNTTERYFIAWTASNSFSFFPDWRPSLWLQKLCVLILTCKIKKFFVHKNKLVENLSNPNHNTSSSYLTTLSLCLVDLKAYFLDLISFILLFRTYWRLLLQDCLRVRVLLSPVSPSLKLLLPCSLPMVDSLWPVPK